MKKIGEVNRDIWKTETELELKEGYYTCLVDMDGFNLQEFKNQYYNGFRFCWYESYAQFIRYININSYTREKI